MLLIVFLSALLFRVPYYVRLFLLVISVVVYATLCGRDSSVMRATLMGVLTIGALLAGRMSNSWRLLGIVLVVMLIRNPYYLLYDLGFVFSFSAVVGIMIFQSRLPKYQGLKGHLMDYLTPTLGATLGVLPMLLFFTGSFNLLSLIVNMIMPPLIPMIMIGGSLTLMILSICSRGRITIPIIRCIDFFYQLASWTTQYGIYLQLDNPLVKILIVVIGWTLLLLLKTSPQDASASKKPSSDTSPSLSTLF